MRPAPRLRIPADRRRRRHQPHGAPQRQRRRQHGGPASAPPQRPAMREAEERPLHRRRVFHLDRHARQQARRRAARHDAAHASIGQRQRQPSRQRDGQVVEDRRLPAAPAQQRQADQVQRAGRQRAAPVRPQPACPRRHRRRDKLIGQDAVAGQAAQRGEQQEQPDRLAVPDVDIGHGAAQHPVADQQIILLVDMDHRIAPIGTAQRDRQDKKDDRREDGAGHGHAEGFRRRVDRHRQSAAPAPHQGPGYVADAAPHDVAGL